MDYFVFIQWYIQYMDDFVQFFSWNLCAWNESEKLKVFCAKTKAPDFICQHSKLGLLSLSVHYLRCTASARFENASFEKQNYVKIVKCHIHIKKTYSIFACTCCKTGLKLYEVYYTRIKYNYLCTSLMLSILIFWHHTHIQPPCVQYHIVSIIFGH